MYGIELNFIFCFIGCYFFALMLQTPKTAILYASLLGAFGYIVYLLTYKIFGEVTGCFLGAMFISFFSEVLAKTRKTPSTVFLLPAVISIVPGINLYKTMLFFSLKQNNLALKMALQTFFSAGAIALAIALCNLIFNRKKVN